MRLSELMSSFHLTLYPQVALVIFTSVFAGVTLWLFAFNHGDVFDKAGRLPLDDGDSRHGQK